MNLLRRLLDLLLPPEADHTDWDRQATSRPCAFFEVESNLDEVDEVW